MPEYFAALTMVLLVGMVVTMVLWMKRKGIAAVLVEPGFVRTEFSGGD